MTSSITKRFSTPVMMKHQKQQTAQPQSPRTIGTNNLSLSRVDQQLHIRWGKKGWGSVVALFKNKEINKQPSEPNVFFNKKVGTRPHDMTLP